MDVPKGAVLRSNIKPNMNENKIQIFWIKHLPIILPKGKKAWLQKRFWYAVITSSSIKRRNSKHMQNIAFEPETQLCS